jgi:hypothetical protein
LLFENVLTSISFPESMKNITVSGLLVIIISIGIGCSNENEASKFRNNYRWLVGKWEGRNGQVKLVERWMWNKNRFEGSGFEIDGVDTLFSEKIFLESFDGTDAYIAIMNSGRMTSFQSVQVDSVTWRFENPDHNFPSIIQYTQESDSTITVSLFARGETAFRGEHSYQLKRIK